MDDVASNLLATLKKPQASVDSKLALFSSLKSHIKHQRIPESAQTTSLECVRIAIASPTSSSLVTTGFSTLGHLIKRLTLQDQVGVVFSSKNQIVQTLLERIGDAKDSYRAAASQGLSDLWLSRPDIVEKAIREGSVLNSNVRAKEAGMVWVVKMHNEHNLQFRGFVPCLVGCLDHADGNVRDCAKSSIVELFRNSPDRAKADLKRQLIAYDIRKSIASFILSQLHIPIPPELDSNTQGHSYAQSETSHPDAGGTTQRLLGGEASVQQQAENPPIEPLYVDSQRDLEEKLRAMQPCFEGREDESNWKARDNSVLKLRRLLQGNAATDFQAGFVAGIKNILDGILKVPNSLRTTMSTNGCQLVQELARTLGPAIDPMVEILLQNFVKMCSATKNIASQNGNATVDAILSHVSYNVRLMQHIWQACQDKNVQPRSYSSLWLKTVIKRHAHNKQSFDHAGGLDIAEKCIRKGLNDANPKVREGMRGTFWLFAETWPARSEAIMSALDAKSKQLLEKDPSNPNASHDTFTSSLGPSTMTNPRAAPSNVRSELKETIAAQKRAALAAKRLPDRPSSAMATLSPAKQQFSSSHRPTPSAPAGSMRAAPTAGSHSSRPHAATTSNTGHGSLMSGPVRRPRRPDAPRPATADPYANRKLLRGETPPPRSPGNSPIRPLSKGSGSSNPSGYAKSTATSALRAGAEDSSVSSRTTSPRTSPTKGKSKDVLPEADPTPPASSHTTAHASSLSTDESLTMVVPNGKPNFSNGGFNGDEPPSSLLSMPRMMEEENLTMLMPNKTGELGIPTLRGQGKPEASEAGDEHTIPQSKPGDVTMHVYEDPNSAEGSQPMAREPERVVLEELPVNEHNQTPVVNGKASQDQELDYPTDGPLQSPSRKGMPGAETPGQDRAEMLKNRRLLASGIDRLHAKTLDPHGFRRLQDLVKSSSKDASVQLTGLLIALVEYLEAPNEALKVNTTKAQNLKSQALTTIRALVTLHRRDPNVRRELGRCLCAVLRAKKNTDMISHMALDLDKTGDEIVRHAQDQVSHCVADVAILMDSDDASNAAGHRRLITMALAVLSKLVAAANAQGGTLAASQLQRAAKLAVRFLDDTDPDVRRADIGLCTELFATFGEEHKEDFWASLKGAREPQLNLVAYYVARRGRLNA